VLFCVALGCSTAAEDHPATTVDLVANTAWTLDTAADNDCSDAAHGPDDEIGSIWYTVETRTCARVTVTQPLLADVPLGATLQLVQFQWIIPNDSSFDVRLTVGDPPVELVHSTATGPLPGATLVDNVVSPRVFRKGEPVRYSVANAGAHAWSLVSLTASH